MLVAASAERELLQMDATNDVVMATMSTMSTIVHKYPRISKVLLSVNQRLFKATEVDQLFYRFFFSSFL